MAGDVLVEIEEDLQKAEGLQKKGGKVMRAERR